MASSPLLPWPYPGVVAVDDCGELDVDLVHSVGLVVNDEGITHIVGVDDKSADMSSTSHQGDEHHSTCRKLVQAGQADLQCAHKAAQEEPKVALMSQACGQVVKSCHANVAAAARALATHRNTVFSYICKQQLA